MRAVLDLPAVAVYEYGVWVLMGLATPGHSSQEAFLPTLYLIEKQPSYSTLEAPGMYI